MQRAASPPATERRLLVWLLAAAALLWLAMAIPLFAGRVYVADDLGAYHLPLRAFYSQQLVAGEPFDWLPSLFSGFYLTGEGQAGTYHPLHLALYRFLPLSVAFDLELLVSYPLMLAGSYLLLRRWLARRDAALLGALAFTFSGFNLLHFVHPNAVAVVAHWPWLLWALDLVLHQKRQKRGQVHFSAPWAFALVSLVLGSEILIGYPQYVWIGLIFTVPYALVCLATNDVPTPRWRQTIYLLLAGVVGVLIGSVQLIPSLDALSHSTRQSADAAFANSGSLHPLNLIQLVAPYLFATRVVGQNTHELGLYCGTVPLLLCAWLLGQRGSWGEYRRPIVAALSVAGVALLLAFGQYGVGGGWQRYLPLVGNFRFPCRSIAWVYAAVSLLAAIAWQRLVEAHAEGRGSSNIPLWAVCGASLAAALIAPWIWPEFANTWPFVAIAPVCFVAAAIALAAAARGSRVALIALILLASVDIGAYGLSYVALSDTERLASFVQAPDAPPNADRPVVAQPLNKGDRAEQVGNRLLLAGFRRTDGYAGLVPARQLDYRDPDDLRVAGVGFRAEEQDAGYGNQIVWLPVADPLPPIRLVTRAIVSSDRHFPAEVVAGDAVLYNPATNYLPHLGGASLDPASFAERLDLTPGSAGTISDLDQHPGRLALSTETDGRQLLVVNSSYHSGWQARVDGQPVPVLQVNRDFLGCVVEAGKHRVTLDFHPFSLRLGKVLSTLGLGLLCAQLVVATWLGRRPAARQTIAAELAAARPSLH
ncbi:MAG TPA: YfhO family protein [Pirellulales bacterium]|jgi:hypothetical protein|nr:YfhO family protein [Pirellulales bacterium]